MGKHLVYQQGGTLFLDEKFEAQPSAVTITLRTLGNDALSTLGTGFSDVENVSATAESLSMVLAATNEGAKEVVVSSDSGTPTSGMLDYSYRLLVENAEGRQAWPRVSGRTFSGSDVNKLIFDEGLPFDVSVGDTAKSVRCSYAVNWSSVTATFNGRIQALWKVTVNGEVKKVKKVYDIVKQEFVQPAEWADVLSRYPELSTKTGRRFDFERTVRQAWEDILRELMAMGVRANLVIPESDYSLRDATVFQCLANLGRSGIVPRVFDASPEEYIDLMEQEKQSALGQITQFVDDDEDEALETEEEDRARRTVWFRQ
tara:strand:- start:877 stop:1821 length:945 start_codon:yes stop_codon:yes gene_type:complete